MLAIGGSLHSWSTSPACLSSFLVVFLLIWSTRPLCWQCCVCCLCSLYGEWCCCCVGLIIPDGQLLERLSLGGVAYLKNWLQLQGMPVEGTCRSCTNRIRHAHLLCALFASAFRTCPLSQSLGPISPLTKKN